MKWKRKFAVFKFTLSRGYVLCQLPMLSIIGAGVMAPYFPEIRLIYLAALAFGIMVLAGWFDVKFNILQEEQKYMTEMNPALMEGLFGDKGKAKSEVFKDKAEPIKDKINEIQNE